MNRADVLAGPAAALLVSLAATLVCCVLLGATLGLAFGGFAIVALVAPPYAVSPRFCALTWTLTQAAIVLPIIVSWIWAAITDAWPLSAIGAMMVVLITYAAMVSTTAKVLARLIHESAASAIATIASLAWLAWPIWASEWVTEGWAGRLIPIHALFAVNAVAGATPWPQHEVIYGLTRLGQDVAYAMPSSIWPAAAMHAIVAIISIAVIGLTHLRQKTRSSS